MNSQALLIFVRRPEAGKVKTRIARKAGEAAALWVYQQLLQHTRQVTDQVEADRYVFYADTPSGQDLWEAARYHKRQQMGGSLGMRMLAAFQEIFTLGYRRAVIIGSDCHTLTAKHIHQAFARLAVFDIVIGPASDGGYYLLGLNRLIPSLFEDINWSTSRVLDQTLQRVHQQHLSVHLLDTLSDVDEWDDVPEAWKKQLIS
jgi:rSAM/selenodomain-associated transferase 1